MNVFEFQPEFNKTVLDNGVRIVTEHHPYSRATSVGFYVDTGTRDEPKNMNGASHFIEHLVFKGTKTRSAYEIAKSLEAVGGELNAYTSREYTCFHSSSLKEDLDLSLDILSDIITHAKYNKDEFIMERHVILNEIDMSKEQLEEYIFDLFFEYSYKGHSLSEPILGTEQSLMKISKKQIMEFYQNRYHGSNLIVSVSGDVDHEKVVKRLKKLIGRKKPKPTHPKRIKPRIKSFREDIQKSSEQIHILLGLPSSSYKDKYRFESYIFNALLGGGMTSRLYQKIREERGLAYSIYSYLHSFSDSGLSLVYAGTSKENQVEVLKIILKEIDKLRTKGISKKELEQFRTQVRGNVLLGADDIDNRMNSLAVNEMVFNRYRPVEEVIDEIESVSVQSLQAYLDKYIDPKKFGLILLGDTDPGTSDKCFGML